MNLKMIPCLNNFLPTRIDHYMELELREKARYESFQNGSSRIS